MERNIGLSYCRVVATVFIVVCHIIKYYTVIPFSQHLGQFFNAGVEMFIILSGYLYGKKKVTDYKRFYLHRYLKICMPIQVWTIIILICSERRNIIPYLFSFFNISGLRYINEALLPHSDVGSLSHTWFVTIIILCYFLIPLMQKVCGKYKKERVFCGLLLLWSATIIMALYGIQIYYFALFLSAYFVAYYNISLKEKYARGRYLMITFVTFALSAGRIWLRLSVRYALFYDEIYVHTSQSLLAVWIMITICILCKWQKNFTEPMSQTWMHKWTERLSYSIYIIHFCLVDIIYKKYDIGISSVAFLILTVCISAVFYKFNRELEQRICKKV